MKDLRFIQSFSLSAFIVYAQYFGSMAGVYNMNLMQEDSHYRIDEIQDINAQILISIKDNEQQQAQYPHIEGINRSLISPNKFQDELSEVIVGKKATRFSIVQDELTQNSRLTFSTLNDSYQSTIKSKLTSKIDESKDQKAEKEIKQFNQSIFSEKKHLQHSLRGNPTIQHIQQDYNGGVNYEKSFYLTKKQQVVTEKIIGKGQKDKEFLAKVIFRNTKYFLELGNESIEVNAQSLQDLYNQLFKRQLFAPLFSYQIYDRWNQIKDARKYEEQNEYFIHLKVYLDKYVDYLNEYCINQMQEVLKTVRLIQQGSRDKKKEAYSYFQFDLKSLIDNVKHFIAETKMESLRKSLQFKIRSIQEVQKQGERFKTSKQENQSLAKTMERTWLDLGNIELLLSFQQTEDYCSKKIESSPETKFKQIWIKYREKMSRQRNTFISKIDLINL